MTSSTSIRSRRLLAVGLSVAATAAATLAVGAGTSGSGHSHSIQADSCIVTKGQKGIGCDD